MEKSSKKQTIGDNKKIKGVKYGDAVLIAKESGMSLPTVTRFIARKQEVSIETESKIYAAWQRVLTKKARHFDALVLEMNDLQSRVDDFKIRLLAAKDSLYKTA